MKHSSIRTLAAAVSIAAAGLGAAGTAAAAPVQLTPATPVTDGGTDPGAVTGSADALLPLLSGSAEAPADIDGEAPATGSADSLGPLLELLATGSSSTPGTTE
ncbi:hypothetical protein IU448_23300 [Nocardia flavorosea]|uniref:hypothetical protein n=1 Tax=Nocardia flavorosea TaxID=53429 RepID=UPI0018944EE5|nr:hypothetical protein [Nocardia flavorosea]MBF6351918.1 hypothetical protein [Nocardia flavorosea]